jgi:hypothetical protein
MSGIDDRSFGCEAFLQFFVVLVDAMNIEKRSLLELYRNFSRLIGQ